MTASDRQALIEEMVALRASMRRFAFGFCQSIADADDIVQAAYERALTRLDQYQQGTRLDHWMFSIVRSVALNQLRSVKRRQDSPMNEYVDRAADEISLSPERGAEYVEVADAIASLPEDQRVAVLLVAVEGLSYREAAGICEISEAALTSRLMRGRVALARALDATESTSESNQEQN